jgi:hypothetical protein
VTFDRYSFPFYLYLSLFTYMFFSFASIPPLPGTFYHSLNGDGGPDLISMKLKRAEL